MHLKVYYTVCLTWSLVASAQIVKGHRQVPWSLTQDHPDTFSLASVYEQHLYSMDPLDRESLSSGNMSECHLDTDKERDVIRTTSITPEDSEIHASSQDLSVPTDALRPMTQAFMSTTLLTPPRESILALGRMAMYAYQRPPDPMLNETDHGRWEELGDWSRNASYGWISEGLRAHLFLSPERDMAVLTFKGTNLPFSKEKGDDWPTHRSDKFNDNLMFSCCCSLRTSRTCSCDQGSRKCDSTCYRRASHIKNTYYQAAMRMYKHVRDKYPQAIILLSGHSLGGSIAALVSAATESPAVAFEAPGEAQFARRLGLIDGETGRSRDDVPVWHIGHTADPVYTGTCTGINSLCRWFGYTMQTRCHLGRQCMFDTVEGLGWLPHVKYHRQSVCVNEVLLPWSDQGAMTSKRQVRQTTWPWGDKDTSWKVPWKCGFTEEKCEDCGNWEYISSP